MSNKGLLVVISGPSGCGKGVVCKRLVERNKNISLSISATTRDKRCGEEEGVTYFYKTKEEFERLIAEDKILEYAKVYSGHYYGTPKEYVFSQLDSGRDVILEIEMQGAKSIRQRVPESVLLFLVPPNKEELKNRIIKRGRENLELIAERLSMVNDELDMARDYDYIVLNDTVEKCVERIEAIFTAEKCSRRRNEEFIEQLKKQ